MAKRSGSVVSMATWSARHPWKAIGLWIVLVAGSIVGGMAVGAVELEPSQEGNGQSATVDRWVEATDLADPISEQVLIRSRSGSAAGPTAAAAARDVARSIAAIPAVEEVAPPVTSTDGSSVLVSWTVEGDSAPALDAMQAAVDATQGRYPSLRIEQIGDMSIDRAIEDAIGDDLGKAERLSLPITLVILFVAFGALIAALVPLLLAVSCVVIAIGLTAVASHVTPVSDAASSVILLIGLAVGVDYSMFFLRRARDERARGAATVDAVEIAAATAGRAIVVSGVTVLIAMSGMFLSGNSVFLSFGIGTMIVVATAVAGSITVLPAMAARLGRHIDRPRIPVLHRLSTPGRESRLWHAVLGSVQRRPAISALVSVGLLVALALPATGMTTKLMGSEDLPRSIPIMQTYDALTAAFPSEGGSHSVVLRAADVTTPEVSAAIDALVAGARASAAFAIAGTPSVEISNDRSVARITLPYPGGEDSPAARAGLTELRQTLVPQTVGRVGDAGVSGDVASNRDFTDQLSSRLPLVFGFVLALTFVLMLTSFRSVPIAALTVALNLLSVAAAYGLLVLVFQNTWAEDLLGFTSSGGIIAWLPLFLFVVLFGLSMDYHVFVLSRIREAFDRGMSTRQAVAHGVTTSAGVVTSAAVVMVAVFAVFATLTTLDFKQLGVGLAAAIAIDATLIRGVLLPACMTLMGERCWYLPSWLGWLPRVEVEQSTPTAATPSAVS